MLNSAQKETDFILHPRVLIGCMRIDSIFKPLSIPKAQLLLSINRFQLNLQNQQGESYELPKPLRKFKLSSTRQINHTFLSLVWERFSTFVALYETKNYSISCEFIFSSRCLDYGYLNMLYFIEETSLNGYFSKTCNNSFNVDIVADKIKINVGPAILHTLLSSKIHWEETLTSDGKDKKHIVITKFVFVNRTHLNICFGQTGTNERIQLQPKECHMYSFRSDYLDQEVTFSLLDDNMQVVESSQSIPISIELSSDDGVVKHILMGNRCLIVRSKKLSATQMYILIKGQIELLSMVSDEFRLEFLREDPEAEKSKQKEQKLCDYATVANDRITFLQTVTAGSNIYMR